MPINLEVADQEYKRYSYLRDNGHIDFVRKANECDNFFLGEQWNKVDKSLLDAIGRPALTINKTLPTIANLMGSYISSRMDIALQATRIGLADVSGTLEKVIRAELEATRYRWHESTMVANGYITSRGYVDARLSFKDNMQGQIEVISLNPRNVLPDCDADEYDPDTWHDVVTSKWMSPQMIAATYNKADAEYLTDVAPSDFANDFDAVFREVETFKTSLNYSAYTETRREVVRNVRVIERQYRELTKRRYFVDPVTGEMRAIPDAWDSAKINYCIRTFGLSTVDNLVQRIRWRVSAGPCVLFDEWSPYEHFTVIPFFPYFRNGKTMGVVENLIDPQEYLNKITSQELHVVNTTANSGWKVETGNLKNMTIDELEQRGAQTGLVVEVAKIDGLEKIEPNQVPSGLERLGYKMGEFFGEISTIDQNALGHDREDVAAKAIREKKKSQTINTLWMEDNLNLSRWFLTRHLLGMIQTYYTEPRIMRLTKDEITGETEEVELNQYNEAVGTITNDLTAGEYEAVITTAPAKDTAAEVEFDQAIALRELGVPIPDWVLIENSGLRSKGRILRELQEEKQSPEAQKKAQLMSKAEELAVEKEAAEVDETQSKSMLNTANAKRNLAEAAVAGMDAGGGTPEDPDLKREEMAHESQEKQLDRDLKREEMQHASQERMAEQGHEAVMTQQEQHHDSRMAEEQRANDAIDAAEQRAFDSEVAARDQKFQRDSSQQQHKQKIVETKAAAKARPKPPKRSK